jgi:hypothetical protein
MNCSACKGTWTHGKEKTWCVEACREPAPAGSLWTPTPGYRAAERMGLPVADLHASGLGTQWLQWDVPPKECSRRQIEGSQDRSGADQMVTRSPFSCAICRNVWNGITSYEGGVVTVTFVP